MMRVSPQLSSRVVQALPTLRSQAKSCAIEFRCDPDEAFQIACEVAVKVEPKYDPTHAAGASFATFAWSHAYPAIRRAVKKERNKSSSTHAAVHDGAADYAATMPSETPRFDETDAELRDRVDDIRFGAAGAIFVRIATTDTPETDYEAAETRARVQRALRIVMGEMEAQDREILERHALGGEPLGSLFAKTVVWRDLDPKAAYYEWRKLMARVGKAMWVRGGVKPGDAR